MILSFLLAMALADPQIIPLWPNGAPGSEGKTSAEVVKINNGERIVTNVHNPSLTVFLPPKESANGWAVVILPGGGHYQMSVDHEGSTEARWLSEHGVAGFVLKYRLAREPGSTYTVEGNALDDTKRALRLVRSRAAEWNIDPARIGIMGFSAGGELAALAATRYDAGDPAAADEIDRQSSRPVFQALIYPGLPKNMQFSKESTPPAFLLCGANDRPNISEGLAELYLAMKKAGVPAELHVYANVGHGFGLRDNMKGPYAGWLVRFDEWLMALRH